MNDQPDQQTFSLEHWNELLRAFGGNLSIDTLGTLYRASYSYTFASDLRELMRQLVREDVVDEWEAVA